MAIQGYDKTSTYSNIATGNVIEAAYFTNEYAEIFDAFKKTTSTTATGHRHDGGDAMGGYVALLSDSDNDTKITLETISISGGAPSYTDSDTITIVAGSATIATIDSGDINVAANKGITFGDDGEKIEGDGTDLTITGNNINLTATADVNIPSGVGVTFATAEKIESDGTDLTITVGSGGDINIPADIGLTFGNDGEKIEGDGTDLTISGNNINLTATADVNIPSGVGITFATAEKIESDGTDLSITVGSGGDINVPANIGITFGDDGEKIEGDGTDLTISASADLNLTATTDINIPANVGLTFGDDAEKIEGDGTDLTVSGNNINLTATADVNIPSGVGLTFATAEKIESDGTDLSITVGSGGDINIPADIGLTFGDDGEKIEGDGTDLTISSSALATIDAGTDITLDADGGDIFFKDDGTTFGSATNTSGNLIIKSGTTTALTFSGANVTGSGTFEATTITASTSFVPDASGGADLGSTSLEFGDLYIADDKKIYLGSDQNFSIEYDEDGNDTTAVVAAGGVSLAPHGTSTGNTTSIQFQELAANGAHYVGFKAADSIAANVIWTLPNADGSANQVIKTDGSGALSWTTPSSGAVTAINNATANELVTIGSTTTELDAEGNLTFDGSTLALTGDATISDDLGLVSDAAVLTFGANSEVTVTHVHNTGLNLKHTATGDDTPIVLTLQTGETDIAADDVIGKVAFQAPDEGEGTDAILVAAAIQARSEGDFSSSANATSIDFMTGASEAAATKWSITSAGSFLNAGTNTIDMNGGELILSPNGNASITASTNDQIDIRIASADDFTFTPNTFTAESGSEIVQTDGTIYMNETANGQQTLGITINQGAADNEVMTFKSSDVAHDGTAFSNESDTFGMFKKVSAAEGGLYMQGFSEGTSGIGAISHHETQPSTSPATSTSTSSYIYYASCYDGSYGYDANSLVWGLRRITDGGSWRSIMFIDEDGDIHLDGSSNDSVFDEDDDAMLCRSLDLMRSPNKTIRTTFDQWTQNHKTTLEDAGIISKIDPDNPDHWEDGNLGEPMINITQLQRLHNGAIWQQRAMFETMKQVTEEMLPGFGARLNERLAEQKLPALPVPA